MLMLCAPAETAMDAVKFVDVSLPAEGNEMLAFKVPSRKISRPAPAEAIGLIEAIFGGEMQEAA